MSPDSNEIILLSSVSFIIVHSLSNFYVQVMFSLFLWVIHVEVYEQTFNMQRTGICANILAALIALICLLFVCSFMDILAFKLNHLSLRTF